MNTKKSPLPMLTALLGITALTARFGLYALGTDHKGLLIPGHPLTILLWALTAAAVAAAVLLTRKQNLRRRYSRNFPPSAGASAGCLLFAAGILLLVVVNRNVSFRTDLVCNILGLLSVPALTAVSICRARGKRPHFVFHGVICLFLAIYILSRYPTWSVRPQLQDSFFPLMGIVLLLLFAYCQTALDVNLGSRRMQIVCGTLAAFCCLAAVPFCTDRLLYLCGSVWALTNLCCLAPAGSESEPAEEN